MKRTILSAILIAGTVFMYGCGSQNAATVTDASNEIETTTLQTSAAVTTAADVFDDSAVKTQDEATVSGEEGTASVELVYDHSMELKYASQFAVDYYEDGYKGITIGTDQKFLLVPEGNPVPDGVDEETVILQMPLDHIYLVATAAMDFFRQLDAISCITLSSQKQSNWYIPEAVQAMESGEMLYAGKYSAPDYERILSEGCDLAIENTMIYHTPEVLEQLHNLGIPTLVEKSSYETDPLGRIEWIKLYAALVDREEMAKEFYSHIVEEVNAVIEQEDSDSTVAFFSITTNGAVTVRKSADYIAKAISLAGGNYVSFDESEEENALSTMTIQMETFYANAKDADMLIYNSTIEGELETIDQLLDKSALLADFKAVQEGNVWCIEKNFYQESLSLGNLILDINKILSEEDVDESELYFLHRLE